MGACTLIAGACTFTAGACTLIAGACTLIAGACTIIAGVYASQLRCTVDACQAITNACPSVSVAVAKEHTFVCDGEERLHKVQHYDVYSKEFFTIGIMLFVCYQRTRRSL